MSDSDGDQGQTVLLPTESHDFDNNAESDTSDSSSTCETSKHPGKELASQKRTRLHPIAVKMINICKEIGLLFLAVFFTYAALTNDPPKVLKSPVAYPFFPKNSIVTDWYRGQITKAYEYAREADIAFVMFYAPWDAKSQDIRSEFEVTARYMQNLVRFTSVNCWQPGSECRTQYSKVYNWPILIAYPAHGRGIVYNGPKTPHHMIKFLYSVMKPLIRVTNEQDINVLLSQYDAVIVGEVNSLPGSLDYTVLYSTAIRLLEKDPFQEIAFAVRTTPKYGSNDSLFPNLRIHMWNETMIYPKDNQWRTGPLLNWILKTIHQVTSWISPLGSKSQQLSLYLQPGPALILFTPRNPLALSVDYYDLLHEVGMEYYNCDNNIGYKAFLLNLARLRNYYKYDYLKKQCYGKKESKSKFSAVVTYAPSPCWANNSCFPGLTEPHSTCSISGASSLEQCKRNERDIVQIPTKLKKTDISCEATFKTSMHDVENDSHSSKNLLRVWKKNECRLHQIAEHYHPPAFSPDLSFANKSSKLVNITGLACQLNSSLTLIALDSLKYHQFAERLGIDILNKPDKTTAVIVDEQMETHHVLQGRLSDSSLREFVFNYTQSNLPRALQSSGTKFKTTHVYKQEDISSEDFYVTELNSDNFLKTILEPKAVIVLYHSKQCSFCSGVSYAFLSAAKSLSLVDMIHFARIDGDTNSLPWEYTMERYPTILFFPARRKSESRAFPQNIPVTVPNLISFIVVNLDPSLKLHAMWSLCNSTKFLEDKQSCIASLRAEILTVIDLTLREWRQSSCNRAKVAIFYKLQQLKNLHLLLAHSPNDLKSIQNYMRRLHARPSRKSDRPSTRERHQNRMHAREEL